MTDLPAIAPCKECKGIDVDCNTDFIAWRMLCWGCGKTGPDASNFHEAIEVWNEEQQSE